MFKIEFLCNHNDINNKYIVKHYYIYLMWYYAWCNHNIAVEQQKALQSWHDLYSTIDDLIMLYDKIQRLSLC